LYIFEPTLGEELSPEIYKVEFREKLKKILSEVKIDKDRE